MGGEYWTQIGTSQNIEIFKHRQWWRLFTALTLHADIGHFIGNLVAGIFLCALLVQRYGYGLAFSGTLLAGASGNALTAYITLLVGNALQQFTHTRSLRKSSAALFAGTVILILTGSTGERVDLLGHIFGFSSGILLGLACSLLCKKVEKMNFIQAILGLFSVSILCIAWLFAEITQR